MLRLRAQLQRTWPEPMQEAFDTFEGGGALFIHAANNAFSNWEVYNDIIGGLEGVRLWKSAED